MGRQHDERRADRTPPPRPSRALARGLVGVALVVAVVGSLGAPLITAVSLAFRVTPAAAQWTLTITLLTGAVAGPVFGRLGAGPHRRTALLVGLALVVVGGALTALSLPFAALIVGRALQGVGLGAVPLLMGIARDRVPTERAGSTVAALAIASTVGIGVGYPVVGLVEQLAGLRAAYALGLVLSAAALVVAAVVVPRDPERARAPIDVPGAVLLTAGLLGVLLVVSEPGLWARPWVGGSVLVVSVVVLAVFALVERRSSTPLVDLRLLGWRPILAADAATLVSGVGMYLVFGLLTRYLQTPDDAGYGFGLSGVAAGAALIPFSLLGFVAGRIVPPATRRAGRGVVYMLSAACVAASAVLLAFAPDSPVAILGAMAVVGFGTGGVSAVTPGLVLVGVPASETSSVLAVNIVLRSVGFAIGSAVAGALLTASTAVGSVIPDRSGYLVGALVVVPIMAAGVVLLVLGRGRRADGSDQIE